METLELDSKGLHLHVILLSVPQSTNSYNVTLEPSLYPCCRLKILYERYYKNCELCIFDSNVSIFLGSATLYILHQTVECGMPRET